MSIPRRRRHAEGMEFAGVIPQDAPDPRLAADARVRAVPFPVMELTPQPALSPLPIAGFVEGGLGSVQEEWAVTFSYTFWRHPENHADPRNERELNERTRRSIEEEPPWPRPAWIVETAQLFRYPMLQEAVRTARYGSERQDATVSSQLVHHANHVLRNSFREQLGLPTQIGVNFAGEVAHSAVAPSSLVVDGERRSALHIDTDPFVYAVGFEVAQRVVCTVVLDRDVLPVLDLAVSTLAVA